MMKTEMKTMKKTEIYDIRLGDRVRWESAAGTIRGEVVAAAMGSTAAGDLIPRYTIESLDGSLTTLCGRASYLDMMKFSVRFRDRVEVVIISEADRVVITPEAA
jgi:hypothetical protein